MYPAKIHALSLGLGGSLQLQLVPTSVLTQTPASTLLMKHKNQHYVSPTFFIQNTGKYNMCCQHLKMKLS